MLQDAVGICSLLWVLCDKTEGNVSHVCIAFTWHAAKLQSMLRRKWVQVKKQSSIGDAQHGIALSDAEDDDILTGKATHKGLQCICHAEPAQVSSEFHYL